MESVNQSELYNKMREKRGKREREVGGEGKRGRRVRTKKAEWIYMQNIR